MFLVKAIITLIPWLSQAICFSPDPSVLLSWRPHTTRHNAAKIGRQQHHGRGLTVMQSQSANDNSGGFYYDQEPRGQSFISQISKQDLSERRQMKRPMPRRPERRPAPNSRGAFTQRYYENNNANAIEGSGFDAFKDNVSANLIAMTDVLKEMQTSQSIQTMDVQALTRKLADMTERLSTTEVKNRMINQNSPGGMDNTNVGTDLDGKFNRKIKDVIDEFDMVNAASKYRDGVGQQGGDYYRTKIAQLEAKINKIDEALQATEDKFNTQMEYVDLLVNQRLDDIDDAAFDSMQFQQPRPPEPFLEERPPPPPFEDLPPPPPPPPQENYDNPYYIDDGTRYFQERNYHGPNVPPQVQEISSSQKKQSDQSVNESSGGHHYNTKNTSFMSAYSKADNVNRRQFQPFRDPRRNQVTLGEQLPRGPPPPRGGFALTPPEPMLPEYFEERFEEPYFYEDGPLMEEDYFYDDMYEF